MRKVAFIILIISHGILFAQSGKTKQSILNSSGDMMLKDDGSTLKITNSGKNLVQFNYKTIYPPDGVDSVFKRSGFIHPVWSPAGNVLTRIFPSDHYHHFGLWNPWAKVTVNDEVIDFWNLNKKQGTVRFAGITERSEGKKTAGFNATLEHILTPVNKPEIIAIEERLTVNAAVLNDFRWQMDYTSELKAVNDLNVILKHYTYGGLGFRATEVWDNKNSTIITSEGNNRKNADSTRARWCIVEGDINGTRSGILFMSHPSNFNHPEPIRVWPENMYNRGDVFFSFSPTKTCDWNLSTGNKNILKYRMIIFDGKLTSAEAEKYWKKFSSETVNKK